MKVFAFFVLFFGSLLCVHADTITDNLAAAISQNSVLPLGPGVALELAQNLMTAQADSSYAASEADSLTLSFAAVLRAIWLEETLLGATTITDSTDEPFPFIQSTIAIDDRVSIEVFVNGVLYQNGEVINFGDVPVVSPEPSTILLFTIALLSLALMQWARKSLRQTYSA